MQSKQSPFLEEGGGRARFLARPGEVSHPKHGSKSDKASAALTPLLEGGEVSHPKPLG
jgi:hypothetical protein